MNYIEMWSYMAAGTCCPTNILSFTFTKINVFTTIWRILFFWVVPVEIVFFIVMFIISMIGKIILFIPLVRFVYSIAFEIIHFISFFIGLLANIPAAKIYANYIADKWQIDRMDAYSRSIGL